MNAQQYEQTCLPLLKCLLVEMRKLNQVLKAQYEFQSGSTFEYEIETTEAKDVKKPKK